MAAALRFAGHGTRAGRRAISLPSGTDGIMSSSKRRELGLGKGKKDKTERASRTPGPEGDRTGQPAKGRQQAHSLVNANQLASTGSFIRGQRSMVHDC